MKRMIFINNWSELSFWEKLDIIRAEFSNTTGEIIEKWDFTLGCRVIWNAVYVERARKKRIAIWLK